MLDMNDLTKKITKKTKAVLAVHSYSGVCDLLNLQKKFVKEQNLSYRRLTQSFLSKDKNNITSGSVGDISCWSFGSTQNNLPQVMEGYLAKNIPIFAKRLRQISNLGYASLFRKFSNHYT